MRARPNTVSRPRISTATGVFRAWSTSGPSNGDPDPARARNRSPMPLRWPMTTPASRPPRGRAVHRHLAASVERHGRQRRQPLDRVGGLGHARHGQAQHQRHGDLHARGRLQGGGDLLLHRLRRQGRQRRGSGHARHQGSAGRHAHEHRARCPERCRLQHRHRQAGLDQAGGPAEERRRRQWRQTDGHRGRFGQPRHRQAQHGRHGDLHAGSRLQGRGELHLRCVRRQGRHRPGQCGHRRGCGAGGGGSHHLQLLERRRPTEGGLVPGLPRRRASG